MKASQRFVGKREKKITLDSRKLWRCLLWCSFLEGCTVGPKLRRIPWGDARYAQSPYGLSLNTHRTFIHCMVTSERKARRQKSRGPNWVCCVTKFQIIYHSQLASVHPLHFVAASLAADIDISVSQAGRRNERHYNLSQTIPWTETTF